MVKYAFTLCDQTSIDNAVKWVRDGRGLRRWVSHDLGEGRPDMLTPGDSGSPHWAYPESHIETPDNVIVELRVPLTLPKEKGKPCSMCEGKRCVHNLARLRNESVEQTRIHLKTNSTWGIDESGDTFTCNVCKGLGYIPDSITFRVRRTFWGGWSVSGAGTKKCNAMVEFLTKHYGIEAPEEVRWDWGLVDNGIGLAEFFKVAPRKLVDLI
jgi:hypothetical protein